MTLDEQYPYLRHKNPHLREKAMREIAETADEQTIDALIALVTTSEDSDYRRTAAQTLALVGSPAVPALAAQLRNHPTAAVRTACASALAALALNFSEEPFLEAGLSALQAALKDPDPGVRLAAVGALSTVGAPAVELLMAAITSEDILLSMAAIGALASIGDQRATAALVTLEDQPDTDPYIRESIAHALERLRSTPWR
ncbi:HEAT repeat domain-containing protein [Gloeobacter kilaueensis]|uniref:HEAT repeat-containing PBS lyase n=1 Tax=Gloeobacter kilaueensis (strain ATCC BAA-2537 / CCAP 1431/1 / ULC 316 / JS1) TaxID=1183438 RepID=U5QNR9_GLOK1|nr:HEAT repeat domain-containing protein [Gloeobacter kilaueensis]AGY60528.1 HEAT repeat-containing PBS lyase [Gloeobacter kilaueensis JS1]